MPVMCQLGPAVPAGLTRYASQVFGADYRDNFFAAMFNLRKVTRHVLEPDGATFKTRDADFLVSDNRDFHPTDVIEDADGSLLVVDTGAWYKLCCPTSQLAKPDVLGAIYRVRRKGAPASPTRAAASCAWNTMTPVDLDEAAGRCAAGSAEQGASPVREGGGCCRSRACRTSWPGRARSRRGATPSGRSRASRARGRARRSERRSAIVTRVCDGSAIYSAGLWRDRAGAAAARGRAERPVSRPSSVSAAEALGRIGDARAVPDPDRGLGVSGRPRARTLADLRAHRNR